MSYTLKMHRVFSAPPERVYRAFVHPDALAKWLAPHGFIAKVEHAEVKPGGSYKTTFTNFSTGAAAIKPPLPIFPLVPSTIFMGFIMRSRSAR